jgi:hypothetical protein
MDKVELEYSINNNNNNNNNNEAPYFLYYKYEPQVAWKMTTTDSTGNVPYQQTTLFLSIGQT